MDNSEQGKIQGNGNTCPKCGGALVPAATHFWCPTCKLDFPKQKDRTPKKQLVFQCQGCLWWELDQEYSKGGHIFGKCFGSIPIATSSGSSLDNKFVIFPHTKSTDRCPNWQKRNTAPVFNKQRNRKGVTGTAQRRDEHA